MAESFTMIVTFKDTDYTDLVLECSPLEKMKDILTRFSLKIGKDIKILDFLYEGKSVDQEKTYEEIINIEDKAKRQMKLIGYELINKKDKIVKSKEIICPVCNKNLRVKIEDYKFNTYGCNHERREVKIREFEKIQEINESKIICEICNENNKGNAYNNEFYRCINCNKNICATCKLKHNDKIIEYDKRNCICGKHNEIYIKYCKECNKNICMKCEKNIIIMKKYIMEIYCQMKIME